MATANSSGSEQRNAQLVIARAVDSAAAGPNTTAGEKGSSNCTVDFDGANDPYPPLNWTPRKKLSTLVLYALFAAGSAFNSSIFTTASIQVAAAYDVDPIVASLGTTLTLLGFAFGPLLWGPLSELYGRKWVVLVPYFVAAMFSFGCGAAKDIQTILICRFFQGLFSSSPITNTGGVLGDIYSPKQRGNAIVVYSLSVCGGPMLAPIVGSAIVTSYLRWRWTQYLVGIFMTFLTIVGALVLDESYAPVLFLKKARRLRLETGNWALHAKHEEWDASVKELGGKYLARPFQLLGTPICLLMTFYASFVYGLLYGCLSALPIVFQEQRGWSPVVSSLPFLALLLGLVIGLAANTFNQPRYVRAVDKNGGKPVPEARLYPMMVGSFVLTAGIFIFAWTSTPAHSVSWVSPCVGIVLIGMGFFPIFQGALNYVIDTFIVVAASAVAATVFMRSIFAAAFPLFMVPMLHAMGTSWGLSVFGFVGAAMCPIPFVFYTYGSRLRAKGHWAKTIIV